MVETQTSERLTLEFPSSLRLHVTQAQFEVLAAANRDMRLERNVNGELIVNPPTGGETGGQNWGVSGELYLWWRNAGEPGKGYDSSTGFILPNGATRSPDASWVSQERLDALTFSQRQGFIPLCPDFIIELRSNSDRLGTLRSKMREYIEKGAKLGWLIDSQNRTVEIYRQDREVEIVENPIELSAGELLPEFVLNFKRIWT